MIKVDSDSSDAQTVYIPHHAVIREHSLTSHLRVVFNASQLISNGKSLNDHLLVGSKLQKKLSAFYDGDSSDTFISPI